MSHATAVVAAAKQLVLIVDDEKSGRSNLAQILERRGFEVLRARSGRDAVRRASNPDLRYILMDIKMPGQIDGIDAAKIISERYPDKHIMFVTGHSGVKEYQARVKEGGVSHIRWMAKPVEVDELLAAIEEYRASDVRALVKETVDADVSNEEVATFLRGLARLYSISVMSKTADVMTKRSSLAEEVHVEDPNIAALVSQREALARDFPKEFIAIMDGEVVGHNEDREKLLHYLYSTRGRINALVARADEPEDLARFRRPRVVR